MDSWDKFNRSLPSIDKFYSNLNMSGISNGHARKLWKEFGIKNMNEYHDLYLRTDVILLANVFESFRRVAIKLLKDPAMLLMFERGIRGGITQSVHRWAIANNPYMGYEYDRSKLSEYLQYLDANNLYGWAMSQPLPTGEFRWVEVRKNWSPKDVINSLVNTDRGYLLEVDVNYPKELHDYHNDLPFMCEKIKINVVEKLVPNLYDKKKYVIHIKALQQALSHGLVLEKIHRIIEFKQSAWMKEYIDFNTKLRTAATNDFEKDFYKLMNNSVFEKTVENIRRHRNKN